MASSETPGAEHTEVIAGPPWVKVPVLSKRTVSTRLIDSKIPPPFITAPLFADCDRPATIAIGTARISGQGVAATKTATALSISPVINQAIPATASATGTKRAAHLFANRTPGAE